MDGLPGRVGPFPKMKTSHFRPLFLRRAPLEPLVVPLEPGMGTLGPKIGP